MKQIEPSMFPLPTEVDALDLLRFIRIQVQGGHFDAGDELPSPQALAEHIEQFRKHARQVSVGGQPPAERQPAITDLAIVGVYSASPFVEHREGGTYVVVVPEPAVAETT